MTEFLRKTEIRLPTVSGRFWLHGAVCGLNRYSVNKSMLMFVKTSLFPCGNINSYLPSEAGFSQEQAKTSLINLLEYSRTL